MSLYILIWHTVHLLLSVCLSCQYLTLTLGAFFSVVLSQPYRQQQQHRASDGVPWFPGSKQRGRQLQAPPQLLQPALRTDLLQQRVRAPVRGGLLWLLLLTRRPLPGLLQCVIWPRTQPERMGRVKRVDSSGRGRCVGCGLTCNQSFINTDQVIDPHYQCWPLLISKSFFSHLGLLPKQTDWAICAWSSSNKPLGGSIMTETNPKYFLVTHLYFYLLYTEYSSFICTNYDSYWEK